VDAVVTRSPAAARSRSSQLCAPGGAMLTLVIVLLRPCLPRLGPQLFSGLSGLGQKHENRRSDIARADKPSERPANGKMVLQPVQLGVCGLMVEHCFIPLCKSASLPTRCRTSSRINHSDVRWRTSLVIGSKPPGFIVPCQPRLASKVLTGDGWIHELKHDSFCILAFKDGGAVRLGSRNGRDWSVAFVAITAAGKALPFARIVLYGEAVAGPSGLQRAPGPLWVRYSVPLRLLPPAPRRRRSPPALSWSSAGPCSGSTSSVPRRC
jgi:hypothetical protein